MKMKEVIEKTGLTDRAVRLYIDEGLALPSIEESYSGRKSIDFSESDVERLKNVALLRKAGFSIADIKSMVDDNSTAKDIIEKFIEQTENNIAHETKIVEKLKGISFNEEVTIETICSSLSETVEEKEVPSDDIKLSLKDKILKIITILFSSVLLVHAVYYIVLCCSAIFDVRFIKLTDHLGSIMGSLFYLGWVVIAILLLVVIFKNIGKRFNRKTKGLTTALLIISSVGSAIMLPITFFFVFCTVTPFYSQTTDPDNYLIFEKRMMSNDERLDSFYDLFEVFPRKIPYNTKEKYPDSIKYFYEYTPCWDSYFGTYDICAEWILTNVDYEIFKKNLPGDFLLENRLTEIQLEYSNAFGIKDRLTKSATENSGYNIVQKGDWTLVYYKGYGQVTFHYFDVYVSDEPDRCKDDLQYRDSKNEFEIENWDNHSGNNQYRTRYDFLICAYNDKEQKVRYIASECCGHANRKGGPYYLSLDW